MKKLQSKQILLLLAMLLTLPALMFSCSEDSDPKDPPPPPPKLDGFYVFGSNTVAQLATDVEARMALAILDPSKEAAITSKDGVYGKFMYIGANSTIQFMEVANEVATTFGAANGGTKQLGTDAGNVPINDMVVHGDLLADGPAIKIDEEGLYYTFVDTETDKFVVVPVKAQMIGDATELQWESGTELPVKSTSKTETIFEGTNINLKGATGYRYRLNDGWHAFDGPGVVTLWSLGVESYQTAWDTGINDVGFFLENTPHKEDGVFTVQLKFDATTGKWTETKTKTGELLIDYSDKEMSIFGNAYELEPGVEGNWGSGTDGYGLHTPSKSGNVYTWSWSDVNLIEEREFIFLENGAWGGVQVDFTGATNGGGAVDDGDIVDATSIGNEFHNYYVATGGTYDVTLVIDATDNSKVVTIVKK
ncbi:MAG TPA: hypothetical protein VD884_23115 [Ohtaekwangia sp.]|nr:hypothetical protein [Ohtaekwangia sp.]